MLKEIKAEDLLFSNEIEDDRTNTYLTLNDYDWMDYQLQTRFRTEEQGTLHVVFEYYGFNTSDMKVEQILNNETKEYNFRYSSDIYVKYLTKYLEKHIQSWNSKYAFNGEEEVIDFFNEVLKEGQLIENKD